MAFVFRSNRYADSTSTDVPSNVKQNNI